MTNEEKELLLRDLCARLFCGIKVSITAHNLDYEKDFGKTIIAELTGIHTVKDDDGGVHTFFMTCYDKYKTQGNDIETIKPYLRSMSSMTEEEKVALREFGVCDDYAFHNDVYDVGTSMEDAFDTISWLLKRHFDINHLIEKGLALEAPEGMYKTN